ncbi:hypothetical protein GPECTOR_1135g407 [Gonium pectorale]|uniref:NADP-dependent oxidoreductase domain-containing protein n=1 Tax=Gonium pectorale TaxID=33097 RepID=A0A150FVA5_GONPE|nr:hypothetical protein GPECTOR_1135g407 [Gonium pectorale]|eukprot:KXZ40960.1 hypothetical protein GPECTOR_1135g407 [Gonium pectorale]
MLVAGATPLPRTISLRNGVELPAVGLGTFRAQGDEARAAVLAALRLGLRHIDTASIYKSGLCARIAVVAYASLGCGDLLSHPAVGSVAQRVGRSPAQVLLRWALQEGCAVIPKSVRPERLADWSEAALLGADWGLGPGEAAELAALEDGHKYCWDPADIA